MVPSSLAEMTTRRPRRDNEHCNVFAVNGLRASSLIVMGCDAILWLARKLLSPAFARDDMLLGSYWSAGPLMRVISSTPYGNF